MARSEHHVPIRAVGFVDRGEVDLTDLLSLAESESFAAANREDGDFVTEVIELFLQQTPRMFETAEQALAAHDGSSLARACHKLKSRAAFFGARRLVQVCRQLEDLALDQQYHRAEAHLDELEDEIDRVLVALQRHLAG